MNRTQQANQLEADQVEGKCRICRCHLNASEDDDMTNLVCSSCKTRPEARRLGIHLFQASTSSEKKTGVISPLKSAREFTAAEKGLIRKVHGYMPAQQLLAILNERLACDLGPDAVHYSMEQLHAEIGSGVPVNGHDWASLRKLLANAERAGILGAIDEQVINDFAVVYSLNQKQVLVLKDIILQARED
jgi:hypothetical protein